MTDQGAPSPTPVWFTRNGDDIISFSEPGARTVWNLRQRPAATLHFNSDRDGQDFVVLHVTAVVEDVQRASDVSGYLDKYRGGLAPWGKGADEFDTTNSVRLRLRPDRVWLGR